MAKVLMVQGTMSNAGKSLLVAGLCRIFKQDGYRVAPFKSQNMALNSFVTEDGLEMGRAQVMQAEAAGIKPEVSMNPILLKPTNHTGSQVIVNGEVLGDMKARDYFAYKKKLIPDILKAFHLLEEKADIIVIEEAGSPAEINLKENDIVNMGMAKMVDAPVLLVGDIDRGGVFAQLLGTLMLLEPDEFQRVQGLIINKFRGDKSILDPGIEMLYEKGKIPVVGVVPFMELQLEDEDSLSERFHSKGKKPIDMAVIRYPRISNFTDFNVFEQFSEVGVRYVSSPKDLEYPDLIILPGSKNTLGDLRWLRESGMEQAIFERLSDTPVFGICGGYQMLGEKVLDPENQEEGGEIPGLGLLPVTTILQEQKVRKQVRGEIPSLQGIFSDLSGLTYQGYEIHMGASQEGNQCKMPSDCESSNSGKLPAVMQQENVYGTYVHGIFDKGEIAENVVLALAKKKGITLSFTKGLDYDTIKEAEYDKLAETLRQYLDMDAIYGMLREANYEYRDEN